MGDADLLQGLPMGKSAPVTEADKAWQAFQEATQPPEVPAEWETNRPSREAVAEFQKKNGAIAFKAAEQAKDFYTRFEKDERAGDAREQERLLLAAAAQLGQTNALARLQALEEAQLKAPGLPEEERLQLRMQQVQRAMARTESADDAKGLADLERDVRALQREFPNHPELTGLLLAVAEGWLGRNQPEKARTLANELAGAGSDDELKEAAQGFLKKIDRLGQPLELKFRAVDGREVDLQAMKNKVVLIDFWATWCGPCMAELPNVKATYEKLHPKGFEIIGISLDREQSALERIVAREKMKWPQYYQEGENKFAEQFGIESIPTMWLVDKKGVLRDVNARDDLAVKAEKLLAE
jgi:thiol-disulfide isomerase/thioredoxin